MWATFWDAFQEVGGRRIVLVLITAVFVTGLLFSRPVHFEKFGEVDVIYQGMLNLGPWPFAVPVILSQVTFFAGMVCTMLMIFTGCPQFVAMMEKGWRELTFSKGTPRWQILFGRYVSLTLLYYVLTLVTCVPLAVRLWWHTGISPLPVLGGALIVTFSFTSLLAIGAFASMVGNEGGVAFPIIAPFGGFVLSQLLVTRQQTLYEYFTSEFGRRVVDWIYYVIPKCQELQTAANEYVRSAAVPTSWPIWTSGLFTVATLLVTIWTLERKSF